MDIDTRLGELNIWHIFYRTGFPNERDSDIEKTMYNESISGKFSVSVYSSCF